MSAPDPDLDSGLAEDELGDDPISAFSSWLDVAREAGVEHVEAVALATCREAAPSVRMVLLRGFDDRGFRFFTNSESPKARDVAANPQAALCFHWVRPRHRQIRIEGNVEPLDRGASEAYFRARARRSRISAWASPQSRVVASRLALEELWQAARRRYAGEGEIPLPPFWGGYLLVPKRIEFWQSREDRLHDRINFEREGNRWRHHRLAP